MLAVRCLLFAAVSARFAVTGWKRFGRRDANIWNWEALEDRGERGTDAEEVTKPSRLLQQMDSEGEIIHGQLDTRVKNDTEGAPSVHLAQSCFQLEAFGKTFILDLELNHNLLSSVYLERHFDSDGRPSQTTGGEHCYYHGRVRGVPGSWAALSTCHGLRGMFSDGQFSYAIEPALDGDQAENAHVVHRMPNLDLSLSCPGCTQNSSHSDNHSHSHSHRDREIFQEDSTVTEGLRRSRRQARWTQHTVQSETKYIELMVVNDHELFFQLRSSTSQTRNFAKAVVNMADAIYKEQLNTRIVLVAMETWSSANMVSVGDEPLLTLRDFMKYRKESIKEHSDAVHLLSGRTFRSSRSGTAYMGGVCSLTRGGGVNEYGNVGAMAITLCQSLGQNIGMMWNKDRTSAGDCRCPDAWLGCIMEDTGFYIPRKFSRCSVEEYVRFLQRGGGSCLFNKPNKLLDPPECGNGFVETGEECDCGSQLECSRSGGACCKKCTLSHDAMCSNGLCCRSCKYEQRGVETPASVLTMFTNWTGTRVTTARAGVMGGGAGLGTGSVGGLWGHDSADRFCYEKLNAEGSEKGNCGRDSSGQIWLQCSKQDVLCGLLMCANMTVKPAFGDLQGEVTSQTIYHQNKYLDCRGGHALLEDGTDLGYVEDGTPCGPNMMCLDRRCIPLAAFNLSTCPSSSPFHTCSDHGTCSNEVKCICDRDYTGKDCSFYDPIPEPKPREGPEKKGPSGTNIIIGSIAGAILLAAIVLGGTGWGFKNIRRGRSGGG
ncbi:hypothetical protein SKAU_G00288870 [Synaphobranchus kaupii]|uniref:Disintegrin and metalloproteinase domain-containing protein 11 n=1 Tax=Synaphobranchus kaupii TaxID=118154 RepID=A0A9Q1ETA4_SYNKA|nr:hypothetical protein SKAU_G00288870 [Synaphobranchus kaupii]